MKLKTILITLFMVCVVSFLAAQESGNYVDVKKTNKNIVFLETENVNHTGTIAENNERKAFLEDRISKSESRISVIEENLGFAREKNTEVNKLNRETQDRKTKAKIEDYRNDIVSLIQILKKESKTVNKSIKNDKAEIEFLVKDSARRENLIAKNEAEIASMKKNVIATESRNSEITSTLDAIKNQIDSFKNEVTTDSAS